jgi:DNA repair photolyase
MIEVVCLREDQMNITKVGITEGGDAGLNFAWVAKLQPANIIISKNLHDKLIEQLLAHKDKIIFHCTCTGWGGTFMEPNVPEAEWTIEQLHKLISLGFPKEQIVLRVDPIIPDEIGLIALEGVLELAKGLHIKRCRTSMLGLYNHVKARFAKNNYELPWSTFAVPNQYAAKAIYVMAKYASVYDFETCAAGSGVGCISNKDLELLGHTTTVITKCPQRPTCKCLNLKYELLGNKKQCSHSCQYCYWY